MKDARLAINPITLIIDKKGEEKAHTCEIA